MPDSIEESNAAVIAVPKRSRSAKKTSKKKAGTKRKRSPAWHVVLWNDDDHTQYYVVELLIVIFHHSLEKARRIMMSVHRRGRGIALTTHKELAELKRDQVLGYHADPYAQKVLGPLRVTIEPAP